MPYLTPEALHFAYNRDGQIEVVNPLNIFTPTLPPLPAVKTNNTIIDVPAILQQAYKNTIDTPLKQFLNKNSINILIFFIGLLVFTVGVIEARVI